MNNAPNGGFTGSISGVTSALAMTMAAFTGIAVYNAIELLYIIFSTFKRHSGLYFWSLFLSTVGIPPYVLGFMMKFYGVTAPGRETLVTMAFVVIGWCMMVTGQSVVLYSRLHLVVHNRKKLRWILGMIIIDAVICHVPIAILSFGANSSSPKIFIRPYAIYTDVQITIFFVQEVIISVLYVYETAKIFRQTSGICFDPKGDRGKTTRKVLSHLIAMNVVIIAMDIALLAIQYTGNFALHTVFKAMIYSTKLKMEFRILNQLIDLTHSSHAGSGNSGLNHRSFRLRPVKSTTAGAGTVREEENFDFGNSAFVGKGGGGGDAGLIGKDQIMVVQETNVHVASAELGDGEVKFSGGDVSAKSRSLRRASGESSDVEFAGRGY
ncbi:hypothetical protein K505DRAFT_329921 [Melanomma pulvis-pyrius CBS 109.77]|uniref:DUF7703 domain-containing protein n=1 Tax=Melanomma pulvis-pyrius CBS 109.77 TaxID=1314802 RepID=A0A6A6WT05_9PLEO|nr:hypothetical protein K505DRAFT_329921 [Melanomma pulvis-pyrius CBS 109.77]